MTIVLRLGVAKFNDVVIELGGTTMLWLLAMDPEPLLVRVAFIFI